MLNLNTNTLSSKDYFDIRNTSNRRLESSECPVPVNKITGNVHLSNMNTTTCLTDGNGHNATSFQALPADLQQKICSYPECKEESTKSVNVTSAILNATGNFNLTLETSKVRAMTVNIACTGEYLKVTSNNQTLLEKDKDIILIPVSLLKNTIGIDIKSETNDSITFLQTQYCFTSELIKSGNFIIQNISQYEDPSVALLFGNVMNGENQTEIIIVQGNPGNNKTEEIRIDTNEQLPLTYNKECLQNNGTGAPSLNPTGQPSSAPSGQPSSIPTGQPSSAPSGQPSSIPTGWPSGVPSGQPSSIPTGWSSGVPSAGPSSRTTSLPTGTPSRLPSNIAIGNSTSDPSENIYNSIICLACILLFSLAIFLKGSRKVRFC